MAIWDNFRLPRAASDAILPSVLEGSMFFVRGRKRVTTHDGTGHKDLAWRDDFLVGEVKDFYYKKITTPTEALPYLALWDADHDIAVANWPLLVPELRAVTLEVYGTSALVSSWTGTVSGSVFTGPAAGTNAGDAFTNLLNGLVEEEAVHGSYTSWRTVNIAGVDYPIAGINAVARTITVTGTPASGSQTLIVYPHRISGSTTTARTFKDAGRATMTPDGITLIAGLRRRDHFQGFALSLGATGNTGSGGSVRPALMTSGNQQAMATTAETAKATGAFSDDGANGALRSGPDTEPNSLVVYRYLYGGQYVA